MLGIDSALCCPWKSQILLNWEQATSEIRYHLFTWLPPLFITLQRTSYCTCLLTVGLLFKLKALKWHESLLIMSFLTAVTIDRIFLHILLFFLRPQACRPYLQACLFSDWKLNNSLYQFWCWVLLISNHFITEEPFDVFQKSLYDLPQKGKIFLFHFWPWLIQWTTCLQMYEFQNLLGHSY